MDKRFRILAVDDDAVNIQLIKMVLKEEYNVFTALNGHDAIDQLEAFKPDLILLDVMMPNLNGFEVCAIIKADERFSDLPIIFLTALDTQEGALRGLELGGIDYLTKPVDFDLLKLRVRNHLALKERNELVIEQRDLLARQKEEYQTLFTEMLDGFALHEMICDAQGHPADYRFLAVNPAFEQLTGLKGEALIGRTVLELLPGTEKHWIETYGQVARTGEAIFFENYSAELKKHFEVKAFRPALNQFACMLVDITERKKIEEAQLFLLQTASVTAGEDFFSALASFLAQSLDMEHVFINLLSGAGDAAQPLAIYSEGRFAPGREYALKDTPCGAVVGKNVCIFASGVRRLFPHAVILQDLVAESYVGTTLWSFDGKPIGLIAVIGRKPLQNPHLAESILKLVSLRAAGEVERKLAEEERQRLEQQFLQVQKLESLGVLVGGIAHDFNNILAIIMGSCFLGQENLETAGEHLSRIQIATARGAELCRQMMAYAGKAKFTFAQVNMRELFDDIMKLLDASVHKNVKIRFAATRDLPCVIGDGSQISQVVMNLIINAAEAIGEAQGEIHVRLEKATFSAADVARDHLGKELPAGVYVCLEVTDNGCGMSDEVKGRLFEPFYTTKFTGRGLGLSSTLGIIQSHHGGLQLFSQPGQGTTFKVYLPAQAGEVAGAESAAPPVAPPWRGRGTILLVDDEDAILLAVGAMLQLLGFTVLKAGDGKEALELYKTHGAEIDFILSDMGMPVMNGYELIQELKKLNSAQPIIISSGFGEMEVAAEVVAETVAGILNKPYDFDQLRVMLKNVSENVLHEQA